MEGGTREGGGGRGDEGDAPGPEARQMPAS